MSEELSIVDSVKSDSMLVSWDMGRRCNFDCTYCPTHRHDNFSPHASLEELKKSAEFMFKYLSLMMPYKKTKYVSVSFTGGEPTVNPHFVEFGKWLKSEYKENYKNSFDLGICLTSNGATSRKMCDNLIENYNFVTISYHCEGKDRLKAQVLENIQYLNEKKFPMKINVMFHGREDYFNECLELCQKLEEWGVDYVPRMIGEYEDNNRYHHKYTDQQILWMKNFWSQGEKKSFSLPTVEKSENAEEKKHSARSLGRPCCGKREMSVCSAESKKWENTKFLKFAKFKDWQCSVNWFFLHIEQQTGLIYHHQTCQANFGGKREPIGSLEESDKILSALQKNLENKTMPIIVCPNKLCGCGLCTPKAKSPEEFSGIISRHVNSEIFQDNPNYKKILEDSTSQ